MHMYASVFFRNNNKLNINSAERKVKMFCNILLNLNIFRYILQREYLIVIKITKTMLHNYIHDMRVQEDC